MATTAVKPQSTVKPGAEVAPRPMDKLKAALSAESVREQFENALAENRGQFVASIIDLYGSDSALQQCDPMAVIRECLKAATLKLPINKSLGFAFVVPYKIKGVMTPQFQIGYKGLIQLAMRTGQYKVINADVVYEGEEVITDRLTGRVEIKGAAKSEKVTGYFAYMEMLNGFTKAVYMSNAEIEAHGKRYSRSFGSEYSPWQTTREIMGIKTTLRRMLSRYGYLSIEIQNVMIDEDKALELGVSQEISENANKTPLEIETPQADPETGEIKEEKKEDCPF